MGEPSTPDSRERALASALVRLDRVKRSVESRMPLGTADMRLLWLLSDGRGCTMREIADALNLEQSTVHRQVTAALREGLLERDRGDGRSAQVLTVSNHGRTLFDAGLSLTLGTVRTALDTLAPHDQDALIGLLETFVEAYTTADQARVTPPPPSPAGG